MVRYYFYIIIKSKLDSGVFDHTRISTRWRQNYWTDPASSRHFRQSRGMRGPITAFILCRPTFSDKRRKSFHQQPPFCAGETEKYFGIVRVNFLFFLSSFIINCTIPFILKCWVKSCSSICKINFNK